MFENKGLQGHNSAVQSLQTLAASGSDMRQMSSWH